MNFHQTCLKSRPLSIGQKIAIVLYSQLKDRAGVHKRQNRLHILDRGEGQGADALPRPRPAAFAEVDTFLLYYSHFNLNIYIIIC